MESSGRTRRWWALYMESTSRAGPYIWSPHVGLGGDEPRTRCPQVGQGGGGSCTWSPQVKLAGGSPCTWSPQLGMGGGVPYTLSPQVGLGGGGHVHEFSGWRTGRWWALYMESTGKSSGPCTGKTRTMEFPCY